MSEEQALESAPLTDLKAALDLLEVRGFRTFGLSGQRRDGGFADVDPPEEGAEDVTEVPMNRVMQVNLQEDPNRIAVRVRLEVDAPLCVVEIDMSVLYTKSQPFTMAQDLKAEFIQNIALMNLWPFIRQHVADVSQRLDAGTTIGFIRPGDGELVLQSPPKAGSSSE